jgi:HD-GYP domain-containing protein (c-di-GMP phosphodiesterase class II)
LVELVADHAGAALRTAELYTRLERTHIGVAEALAAALGAREGSTPAGLAQISELAVEVGRELRLPEDALRDVRYGAIFHDIGKITLPDAVLQSKAPLTERELEAVRHYPLASERVLSPVPFLGGVRRIVRHDRERWDGGGYPDGLRGPEIPIGARIVFVVGAYHAMISDRSYRRALSSKRARDELREGAGTQFDPEVVDAFLAVLDRGADDSA